MSAENHAKIGSEHLAAMARLGLRELRAATYSNSNVAQSQEYGLYGTATPGEVAESRKNETMNLEEESAKPPSILSQRLEQSASRQSVDGKPREMELDR